jgi:hypothetical protein
MVRFGPSALALVLALGWPASAPADDRTLMFPGETGVDQIAQACAQSASSCEGLRGQIDGRIAAALMFLAEGKFEEVYPLARLAADAESVLVRVAAAQALGSLSANAEDAAILAELADDPVPAVRAAAIRSLHSSGEESGRALAMRADFFAAGVLPEDGGESAESAPVAAAMGVPMPADAVFLHYTSDPAAGRYAWATHESAAKVLARLQTAGKVYTLEAHRQTLEEKEAAAAEKAEALQTEDGEMPSAEQLASAMAMAQQMMAAMEETKDKSFEEQANAMAKATGGAGASPSLDAYDHAEWFGEVRLVVVPLDKYSDAFAVVYADRQTGTTGITVYRSPIAKE